MKQNAKKHIIQNTYEKVTQNAKCMHTIYTNTTLPTKENKYKLEKEVHVHKIQI